MQKVGEKTLAELRRGSLAVTVAHGMMSVSFLHIMDGQTLRGIIVGLMLLTLERFPIRLHCSPDE
jgi:hypothetical protein